MVVFNRTALLQWKAEIEQELARCHTDAGQLRTRISELDGNLNAVKQLLGERGQSLTSDVVAFPKSPSGGTKPNGESFTPVHLYWPAILSSLVEQGGRSSRDNVIKLVGQKLKDVLTPADRAMLPSGLDVRWTNRVAWQRFNMIKQGLLRSDSPRGIWEITESGREWLADFAKGARKEVSK